MKKFLRILYYSTIILPIIEAIIKAVRAMKDRKNEINALVNELHDKNREEAYREAKKIFPNG
jgi:hypothetical protein